MRGSTSSPGDRGAAGAGPRVRLDALLVERGLADSRQRAQAVIMAGLVYVDGRRADKSGARVPRHAAVEVRGAPHPYVSRGGVKLAHALDVFGIDPAGARALDLGASTGGFTDALLRRGAAHVVAADVGRGQLHERLRRDPRVTVLEETNARYLTREAIGAAVDLVTMDLSFISVAKVFPALAALVREGGDVVVLVKPQFEAAPREARRGVVRDPAVHRRVVLAAAGAASRVGLGPVGVAASPLLGPEGNVEFFLHLRRGAAPHDLGPAVDAAVRGAVGG